jgi:hypothetical protein
MWGFAFRGSVCWFSLPRLSRPFPLFGRGRKAKRFLVPTPLLRLAPNTTPPVAGTVAGTTFGVAKGATVVAVRVLDCEGSGFYSWVIGGIDWVTLNAQRPAVANMSLGGGYSQALNDAVTGSINAGVVYALAAGNDNANACNDSPASTATALTVAATGYIDQRAWFSNWGSCVDLFAPGVDITSDHNTSDAASAVFSGTSMASPHVAGAAALYLQGNSSATPAEVAGAFIGNATANQVTSPGEGTPNRLLYMGFLNGSLGTWLGAQIFGITERITRTIIVTQNSHASRKKTRRVLLIRYFSLGLTSAPAQIAPSSLRFGYTSNS